MISYISPENHVCKFLHSKDEIENGQNRFILDELSEFSESAVEGYNIVNR